MTSSYKLDCSTLRELDPQLATHARGRILVSFEHDQSISPEDIDLATAELTAHPHISDVSFTVQGAQHGGLSLSVFTTAYRGYEALSKESMQALLEFIGPRYGQSVSVESLVHRDANTRRMLGTVLTFNLTDAASADVTNERLERLPNVTRARLLNNRKRLVISTRLSQEDTVRTLAEEIGEKLGVFVKSFSFNDYDSEAALFPEYDAKPAPAQDQTTDGQVAAAASQH